MKKPIFFLKKPNTFTSNVSLDVIKQNPDSVYEFTINDDGIVTTSIDIKNSTDTLIRSTRNNYTTPVNFDGHTSWGNGCGGGGIWFCFDFEKGIVYIEGDDIDGSLGLID